MLLKQSTVANKEKIMAVDKDKNVLNSCTGSASYHDDKIRGLPAAEGWDKNIKRKRSVGSVIARTTDGDRETKQALLQIRACESHPRSCDGLSFRSASSSGNKMDGSSQQVVGVAQNLAKREQDSARISTDQREHPSASNMEHNAANATAKTNIHEGPLNGNQSNPAKGRASRSSKPVSNSLPFTSPILAQTSGTLDGWEHTHYLSNDLTSGTSNNRKHSLPPGTTSPAITQWGGQRQQKSSRARRTNVVSPVSSHDESQSLIEGSPSLENGAESASSGPSGALLCKGALSNTQLRPKVKNFPTPVMSSENEEFVAPENKSKVTNNCEGDDGIVNLVQKIDPVALPMKKNNCQNEEPADGVIRRSVRSSSQPKFGIPLKEKLEVFDMKKLTRSGRSGSDRSESKVGHPSSKKAMDRRGFIQPGKAMNNCNSQLAGDYCDDHDEIIAAAGYAHYISSIHTLQLSSGSSSDSFWDEMRPFFAYVSSDKVVHLQDMIKLAVDMDEYFGTDVLEKDGVFHQGFSGDPPTRQNNQPNANEHIEPSGRGHSINEDQSMERSRKLETNGCFEMVIPLSQRLLAAIIPENDTEFYSYNTERNVYSDVAGDYLKELNGLIGSEAKNANNQMELELSKCLPLQSQDYFRANASRDGSSILSNDAKSLVDGEPHGTTSLPQICTVSSSDISRHLCISQSMDGDVSRPSPASCMYEHMSLDEKILLELQSIGIYLEDVPDLYDGDEEIDKTICELKLRLYEQIGKNKERLCSLDEAVRNLRLHEEGKLEQLAMNKLVEMAYGKLRGGRGSHGSSHRGGANKFSKQSALAFAKRVLDKWQKFVDTGKSCFSEPPYRDALFSTLLSGESKYRQTAGCLTELYLPSSAPCTNMVDKRGSISLKRGDVSLDSSKAFAHISDKSFSMNGIMSNRGRKRELLLGEVVGSESSRTISVLGKTLPISAKGKRSERDRDQQKDTSTRRFSKFGHQPSGSLKGERRKRARVKQNITQLATTGDGSSNSTGAQAFLSVVLSSEARTDHKGHRTGPVIPANSTPRVPNKMEIHDFSNLPLHVSDELGTQAHDISTWLNVDEDSLQDTELMGLEVPMDDLSELDMNF